MKPLLFLLIVANFVLLGCILYAENRSRADAPGAALQIAPEKLKLLAAGGPPPGNRAQQNSPQACFEWGSFGVDDAQRAAAALAKLPLAEKQLSQRSLSTGHWVHMPAVRTKAEADKIAAAVKARGVSDLSVVRDGEGRYTLSLGVFRTEDAAADYLVKLRTKGVRSAVMGPREARNTVYLIRDPDAAVTAALAQLKAEFPGAELKPAPCAEAPAKG